MNELERLLAAVPHPEPSEQLDRRVSDLLSQPRPIRPRARWKDALAWCATAASVGLVGFYCGRWSAGAAPGDMALKTSPKVASPLTDPDADSGVILNLPLQEDQLASLFLQTAVPAGMFGNGSVKIEVSASP